MRKFWMVVAVGLLVGAVAVPAMAIDFQYKGAFRWRLYSLDGRASIDQLNSPLVSGSGVAPQSAFAKGSASAGKNGGWQGDLRFRPYVIASDDNGNVQSHLRFEIGDTFFGDTSAGSVGRGSGGATGADGVAVEVKWAFIDIQLPGGIPLRMRGGVQPWLLPKSIILDDDVAGVRFYGAKAPFTYEIGWMAINQRSNGGTQAFANQAAAGPSNDDINAWQGKLDWAIAKPFNPYVYAVYKHGTRFDSANNSTSSDGYWFGLGSTGTFGIAKYDVDFVYMNDDPHGAVGGGSGLGGGSESRNLRQEGWFVDGGIEAPVGPLALGLRFMYATGDKLSSTNKSEQFGGVMDSSNTTCLGGYTANGQNELWWNSNGSTYFSWGPDECPGNSWTIGVYGVYRPVKALKLKLDYFYIGASKSETNVWTGKSMIGHEIAFVAEYTVYTGTRLFAMAGVLLAPGDGPKQGGGRVDLKDPSVIAVGVFHDF